MPNLITIEQYKETMDVIEGKKQLNPVFRALKDWYYENTGFEIYNFYIQKDRYIKDKSSVKKVLSYLSNGLLVEKDGDFIVTDIFGVTGQTGEKIKKLDDDAFEYFKELCSKHDMFDDIEWGKNRISGFDFNPIWWCETISKFSKKAVPKIKEKYNDVPFENIINTGLGGVTVFFATDRDLQDMKESGVCESIEKFAQSLLKKKNINKKLLGSNKGKSIMKFSSKETLDRDYKGNLFFFYK